MNLQLFVDGQEYAPSIDIFPAALSSFAPGPSIKKHRSSPERAMSQVSSRRIIRRRIELWRARPAAGTFFMLAGPGGIP
jgi:hypothetical protein